MVKIYNPPERRVPSVIISSIPIEAIEGEQLRFLSSEDSSKSLSTMPMQPVVGTFHKKRRPQKGSEVALIVRFTVSNRKIWLELDRKLIEAGLCVLIGNELHFTARTCAYTAGGLGEEGVFSVGERASPPDTSKAHVVFGEPEDVPPSIRTASTDVRAMKVSQWNKSDASITAAGLVGRTRVTVSESDPARFEVPPTSDEKNLGAKGERLVEELLRNREATTPGLRIKPLNEEEQTGVGHDFEVYQNNVLLEVVEVKTTACKPGSLIKLSKLQFEEALRYHAAGSKVRYWLYCLYNANSTEPELVMIEDPIAWIADGRFALASDVILH